MGKLKYIDTKIDALEHKIETKIDALDKKFEAKIDALDKKFEGMNDRLQSVEGTKKKTSLGFNCPFSWSHSNGRF